MMAPLLAVEDLRAHFRTDRGVVRAVDGIDFTLSAGGSLGIVGESGSGKTVTTMAIMRLLEPPGFIAGGRILLDGHDLLTLPERDMQGWRGRRLCLVFQDPMSALNPVYRVGDQVVEAIEAHGTVGRSEALARTVELFRALGIPAPERRIREYPHQLSGGMRQRVVIAMALANRPELLILDEPTTALDVTVQAQILDLVRDLRRRTGTAVLLITHDFGVVEELCDDVVVMYGGRVMEQGTVAHVTADPLHPYTRGLLASVPSRDKRGASLAAIVGSVPSPLAMPPGCPFQPRCPQAMPVCDTDPGRRGLGNGRSVACWLY